MNSCGNRAIKHIMFAFNFIFVITGIIILAVGVSVKTYYYPYDTFLDNKYFSLPNMLIATGSLIFFISLLGCYGAMRENWFLLIVFSVLLSIIFIFELSVGIAGYVLRDKTSDFLDNKLTNTMEKYKTSPAISSMWDIVQEEFQCCGVRNYSDWHSIFSNSSLPISCCPMSHGIVGAFYCNAAAATLTTTTEVPETTTIAISTTEPSENNANATNTSSSTTYEETTTDIVTAPENQPPAVRDLPATYPPTSSEPYQYGCHAIFGNFVKQHAVDIGAVGIALAVIQLGGIFLSFYLSWQLKNGYYST